LMKLYQLFGYEPYDLDMGIPDSPVTHAITLVPITVDHKIILSIQDAYFDISYTNQTGYPLDYLEMLNLLQQNRDEQIRTVPSNEWKFTRDRIVQSNETCYSEWLERSGEPVELPGDRTLCRVIFSVAYYEERKSNIGDFYQFLAQQGHPRCLLYMYLYPLQLNECYSSNLTIRCNGIGLWPSLSVSAETVLEKALRATGATTITIMTITTKIEIVSVPDPYSEKPETDLLLLSVAVLATIFIVSGFWIYILDNRLRRENRE